jgi:hypothetical protein
LTVSVPAILALAEEAAANNKVCLRTTPSEILSKKRVK